MIKKLLILTCISIICNITGFAQLPADFPGITVNKSGETGDGLTFLTVSTSVEGVGYYVFMLNDSGKVVNYRELQDDYSYDFKVQPNGLLSYAQFLSHHSYSGGGNCVHIILDENMNIMDSVQAVHGYVAEAHDYQLLPNGNSLLFGYYLTQMDLSDIVKGGYPNALVSGGIVQEIDPMGNCVWQWKSWDYYSPDEYSWGRRSNRQTVSAFHLNTINLDDDGHLFLATPNWTRKINRQTGEVMWDLGGSENEFSFSSPVDSAEAVSHFGGHAFHRLENGNVLIYDNGGKRMTSPTSQAHEYMLDEESMLATHVKTFTHDSIIGGWHRGNVQRLPNGNTMIGWGGADGADVPTATELDTGGNVVYDIYFDNRDVESYRAVRHPFPVKPHLSDTQIDIAEGNEYDFMQGDTASLGVSVKITTRTGIDYCEMTMTHYRYAPQWPQFTGRSPMVIPERFMLSGYNLGTVNGEISFDSKTLNIKHADKATVYYRQYAGQPGLFIPLNTEYNSITKVIKASFESIEEGEFIITYPDLPHMVFRPKLTDPADGKQVNENYPVHLEWSPAGFFNGFTLQIASDEEFSNIVDERNEFRETVYDFDPQPDTKYFWRVKTTNDAGESDWSDTLEFYSGDPYIALTSPSSDDSWQRGLDYFVTWDDNLGEDVHIELYKSGDLISIIDTAEYRNGYNWEVPADIEPGQDYNIVIRSIEDKSIFDSLASPFEIMDTSGSYIGELPVNELPVRIYPNPANDYLYFQADDQISGKLKLELYNSIGHLVTRVEFRDQHRLMLNQLESGIYFIRIEDDSSKYFLIRKFVKL